MRALTPPPAPRPAPPASPCCSTGFNQEYDAVYDRIEPGRCYLISGGTLKPVNRQWARSSHAYEITLNRGCEVTECEEPGGADAINKHDFDFSKIATLETAVDESSVDVYARAATSTA